MKQRNTWNYQERALGSWAGGSNYVVRTVSEGPRTQAEGGHSRAGKGPPCSKQTKCGTESRAHSSSSLGPSALQRTWHGIGPQQINVTYS